jgi:hypothetical protein
MLLSLTGVLSVVKMFVLVATTLMVALKITDVSGTPYNRITKKKWKIK